MFLKRGYEVFWPASYSGPVDFLVLDARRTYSVQVKSAHLSRGKTLRVNTSASKYTEASFDILVAVCPEGKVRGVLWKSVYPRHTLEFLTDMVPL